jgi:hypothetical protein
MARIALDVPLVQQGNNPDCWQICALMVMAFKGTQSLPKSSAQVPGGFNPRVMSGTWNMEYRDLRHLGFSPGTNTRADEDWVYSLIHTYGPLVLLHYAKGFPYHYGTVVNLSATATHAIVLTGLDTDKHKTCFNNPWGTRNVWVDSEVVAAAIRRVSSEGNLPIWYMA